MTNHFDRIYEHGGVFVLFAEAQEDEHFVWAENTALGLRKPQDVHLHNWGFLSVLDRLRITHDRGQEVYPGDSDSAKAVSLASHLAEASFNCTVRPTAAIEDRWITLAKSKYDDPVAGIICPAEQTRGWVFILPRLKKPGPLLVKWLGELLPNLRPDLFPEFEGKRWTRRPEYEHPRVAELQDEIREIEENSRQKIRAVEESIENERKTVEYLHDLLTETGTELVTAVIQALHALGFLDVRDVDESEDGLLREDIQVWDRSPTILIEVKGIGGLPKESDSLQVTKYLIPRMREWDRTDVRGLAVINQQRNLPALAREHDQVFQKDVVTNAEAQQFAVMTTWDLFRLVRAYERYGWTHDHVVDLFYTAGRVRPIPNHYVPLGEVDGYWEEQSAVGIRLTGDSQVAVGDVIAFDLPDGVYQETVGSIQLDGETVPSAAPGQHAGFLTSVDKGAARTGVPVFIAEREGGQNPAPSS